MEAIQIPAAPTRSASTAFRSSAVGRTRARRLHEGRVPFGDHVDAELGSVALSRMVANFIDGTDRWKARPVAVDNDSGVSVKNLKELVRCSHGRERKLLEETRRLVGGEPEGGGHGDQEVRARVRDGLWSLGFNASICTSKWDQTPRYPPGQHEYIDIVIDEAYLRTPAAAENRIIIDLDFRSEFEVARCTRHYAAILRNLPEVFVGRQDRLRRLVTVVSDAAVKSLRRKGMHVAPWRRPEYMLRKWFSPVVRRGRPGRPPRVSPSPLAEFVFDHQVGEEGADDDEEEEEDVEEEWEEEEEEEEDEDEERAWRTPAFPPRVFRGRVGPWALA